MNENLFYLPWFALVLLVLIFFMSKEFLSVCNLVINKCIMSKPSGPAKSNHFDIEIMSKKGLAITNVI